MLSEKYYYYCSKLITWNMVSHYHMWCIEIWFKKSYHVIRKILLLFKNQLFLVTLLHLEAHATVCNIDVLMWLRHWAMVWLIWCKLFVVSEHFRRAWYISKINSFFYRPSPPRGSSNDVCTIENEVASQMLKRFKRKGEIEINK